jgi:hypothetical protein
MQHPRSRVMHTASACQCGSALRPYGSSAVRHRRAMAVTNKTQTAGLVRSPVTVVRL